MTQSWSISEGARKSWDRRVPYYLRIRDHFASLIEAGTLAPQSKLPPERAVGDAFGITRMTIRQALFQLEAEGLIYRLIRRGWFVSPPRLRYDPTANMSFTENALAYNLANFMRTLALPKEVEHWSLTTLQENLVKIGAKVVRHGRYVTFKLAEVAISRALFAEILRLIDRLRPAPLPP